MSDEQRTDEAPAAPTDPAGADPGAPAEVTPPASSNEAGGDTTSTTDGQTDADPERVAIADPPTDAPDAAAEPPAAANDDYTADAEPADGTGELSAEELARRAERERLASKPAYDKATINTRYPTETARVLLEVADELKVPRHMIRTVRMPVIAFVVPKTVADAAHDRLLQMHAELSARDGSDDDTTEAGA